MTLLKSKSVTTPMPVTQLSPLHDFQPPSLLKINLKTGRVETHSCSKGRCVRNLFVSQPFFPFGFAPGKQESEKVE